MATSPCLPALSLERLVNPTERQREFLKAIAEHDFVLYGGAMGGGKSYILRWWLVLYLVWCHRVLGLRNVTVGLFCENYTELYDRQISKIKFDFPEWLGHLRESGSRNFVLHPEYGGGIIALRNLDDPSKYQSAEFAAIAVDELTKNSKEVFDFLRTRLRWPGIDRAKFAGATNPGGPGHAWVKKLWKERNFPPELDSLKDQFAFVQAKASDNPYVTQEYYKSLLTLPPDMARKFADGDWNVFTGQFFTNFDEKRHVIRRQEFQPKPWHTRWLSGDWGFDHPACFHWHARDEKGKVTTYRELWGRGINESEWGRRIAKLSEGEKIAAFFFSWDAFGRLHESNRYSIADMLGRSLPQGIPKPSPADASPGERVVGWRLMSQLLDADMWAITDDCPKLVECMPMLIRNEDKSEDVLKIDYSDSVIGDDPADSARYGLKMMLAPRGIPKDVQREEALKTFDVKRDRVRELKARTLRPGPTS